MEINFDATTYEAPPSDFDPLPEGWYSVIIAKADDREIKDGSTAINLGYEVIEGQYQGRWIFEMLCIQHRTSDRAITMARNKMKAICDACSITAIKNNDSFIDKTLQIYVKISKEEYQGQKQNTIAKYRSLSEANSDNFPDASNEDDPLGL